MGWILAKLSDRDEAGTFERVISILRNKKLFMAKIWELGYLHRNLSIIKEYEAMQFNPPLQCLT